MCLSGGPEASRGWGTESGVNHVVCVKGAKMGDFATKSCFSYKKNQKCRRYQQNAAFNAKIVKHDVNLVDKADKAGEALLYLPQWKDCRWCLDERNTLSLSPLPGFYLLQQKFKVNNASSFETLYGLEWPEGDIIWPTVRLHGSSRVAYNKFLR